eukprot:gene4671-biopygen4589
MFVASGHADVPLLGGVEPEVDIAGDAVAADLLRVFRTDAVGDLGPRIGTLPGTRMACREHVAAIDIGSLGAGAGLVAFAPVLQAERHVQRLGQADLVGVFQVEVGGELVGDVDPGGELVRCAFAQGRVLVVVGALLGVVATVGAAQVPTPTAAKVVALGTESRLEVRLVDQPVRAVAVGVTIGPGGDGVAAVGQAEVLAVVVLPGGQGGKRVQRQVVVQRQVEVVRHIAQLAAGRAVAFVGVVAGGGFARVGGTVRQRVVMAAVAVAAGLVVALLVAGVEGHVEHPGFTHLEAIVQRLLAGAALAVVVLAQGGVGTAAGGLLEDDIDHPGNRIRAVLRRCTVAQHLHMVDGSHRDQVEVAGGRAAVDAVDVQGGAGMAAFAVDQHQYVRGGEAA